MARGRLFTFGPASLAPLARSTVQEPTPASPPPLVLAAENPTLTFPLESRWATRLGSEPAFPSAYDSGYAFVPLRNGRLSAVSITDGSTIWSIEMTVTTAPAAGEGLVFAAVAGTVEARSQLDGKPRWRTAVEARLTAPLHWDSGWLIASSERGELLVLRGSDGEMLWRRELGSTVHALPAPAGERLYLSLADGRLMAMELQNGNPLWTKRLKQPSAGILALDDRLFLGSLDNYFYCLSAEDGDTRWRVRTGADILGSPVIDQRHVYFVSLDNVLRAVDRGNGSLRWRRQLSFRPSTGPLLAGETVVVTGIAAELRAYASRTGVPAGELILKSEQGEELQLAAPPAFIDGISAPLIILTRDGRMEGLGPAAPPAPPLPAEKPLPPAEPAPQPAATPPSGAGSPPPPTDKP